MSKSSNSGPAHAGALFHLQTVGRAAIVVTLAVLLSPASGAESAVPETPVTIEHRCDEISVARCIDESRDAHREPSTSPLGRAAGALVLVGASALLDRPADRWATRHHGDTPIRILRGVGDDAPVAIAALVAGDAFFRPDAEDGRVAWESVKASVATATIVEVTKVAVDRSRPSYGRGASDFGHEKRADSSFPSFHTAVAWSAITPIAEHYDAPWLYGVAALTNFSRVAGRDHWLSDTVAGAAIGWWMGDLFHRQGLAADGHSTAAITLLPHGIVVTANFR